ncbi:hypothetical protein ASU31_10645 [Pedobacter ginsenosidimutans]|uniref:Uncharacterized protein n=2 Tax=Pedobacter ginsenosidimutans TaxID=687842 RepID=A0A0T5VQ22_9SPHI|nr:hypothetical protein ASU31_10645 [Pedobacter ginsenosidimutans]
MHGRSDQRFCNDNCRNTYNRNKRAADKVKEHENMPEIFRIIKKNYQILKKRCDRPCEENESFMTDTTALIAEGFNPKFFTSIATDSTGSKWYCVFEIGFIMGVKDIFIKDFPKQAQV